MGLFRKMTSIYTLGAVDFRSDKERIALYGKLSLQEMRAQTALIANATQPAPEVTPPAFAQGDAVLLADGTTSTVLRFGTASTLVRNARGRKVYVKTETLRPAA
jgi:hypothetical protein